MGSSPPTRVAPTRPLASNLNFAQARRWPTRSSPELSTTGSVCLYVGTNAVDLIADVSGLLPCRARGTTRRLPPGCSTLAPGEATVDGAQLGAGLVAAGSTLVLPVAGRGGVPADATSVVLNVTAVGGLGVGFVTVFPCDTRAAAGLEPQLRRRHRHSECRDRRIVGSRNRVPVRRHQPGQPRRRRQRFLRVIRRLAAALTLVAIGIPSACCAGAGASGEVGTRDRASTTSASPSSSISRSSAAG